MAWLQNLAGRAENLLNKIDQNAATVLSDNKSENEEVSLGPDTHQENYEISNTSSNTKGSNSSLYLLNRSHQSSPTQEMLLSTEICNQEDTDRLEMDFKKPLKRSNSISEDIIEDRTILKNDDILSSSSFTLNQEIESLHEKVAQLEEENQKLHKKVLNLQHLYSEVHNENTNYQLQLDRANEQLLQAQKEKDQYVARAQRILQEKEKLISLKENQTSDTEVDNIYVTYYEEMKKELEFQQEKNRDTNEKLNKVMSEMHSLQVQHRLIQNGLNQSNQLLEQSLENEKKIRLSVEEECLQKNKELQAKNHEMAHLQELLNSKEMEIKQLQDSIKQKQSSNANYDLEYRIDSLTRALMIKQNALEKVTTERNALKLQWEKIESEHRQNIAQLKRERTSVVNIMNPHEEKITVPHFMRVSPFDAGVTKRVKNAYSTLDALTFRTGIFLRRYPVARVFVLSYMVLLHVWVLFILLIYAPSSR